MDWVPGLSTTAITHPGTLGTVHVVKHVGERGIDGTMIGLDQSNIQ